MKGKNKKIEKSPLLNWICLGVAALGFILVVLGFVFVDLATPFKFFGVIAMSASAIILSIKSGSKPLLKSLSIMALTALVLTWLLPNGAFSEAGYTDYGMQRVGLTDIPTTIYYSIYFVLDKLIYLVILAGFYSVLAKVEAYQNITSSIAKAFKKKEIIVAISTSIIFILLTSFISQTFIVLLFVPFVISILSKMKMDKITAFAITFGSILVGAIAAPYGTEGLTWFNSYAALTVEHGFDYRLIIQLSALVLFILFIVLRLTNIGFKKEEKLEEINELFVTEKDDVEVKNTKNAIPLFVILGITALLAIVGYINWFTNFELAIFNEWHASLLELTIGGEIPIFQYILGNASSAFGNWDLMTMMIILVIMTVVITLVYRINFSKVTTIIGNGLKTIAKPLVIISLVYLVFVIAYTSSFMSTFSGWAFDLTTDFNPATMSLSSLFSSIFHTDLGYTGYIYASYFTSTIFTDYLSLISVIYTSIYGVLQLVVPTSVILVIGLVLTKLSYKEWLKYIWMFFVGMIIVLTALFSVVYLIA